MVERRAWVTSRSPSLAVLGRSGDHFLDVGVVSSCWNFSFVMGRSDSNRRGSCGFETEPSATIRFRVDDCYVLLQITEPKTRFKAARHQVARVDQPQLVKVIELAFKNFSTSDPLWPFSGQTLRGRFGRLLDALGLSGPLGDSGRGLDLGSLRAGGATWLLQTCEDSELVRRRGRWLNSRTMEIYIQETSALQFLPSLKPGTRKLILHAVAIFPKVLAQLFEFERQGIPTNAWRLLLCG